MAEVHQLQLPNPAIRELVATLKSALDFLQECNWEGKELFDRVQGFYAVADKYDKANA